MMIHDPPKKLSTKELKVNIPVTYHLRLHEIKLLEGRHIHGVIEEALDLWFRKVSGAGAAKADNDAP